MLNSIAVYFVLCIVLVVHTVFIAVSCGKFRDEWWWRGWHFDGARVLILRTWFLIRTFLAFWVLNGSLFIFQGPYFHFFGFIHAKKCQFSLHVYNNGSGLNCWQILIFTYAYALIFIHRRFGSLSWLLGVLTGSLFPKKMGPYLKPWGSFLVLEAVL